MISGAKLTNLMLTNPVFGDPIVAGDQRGEVNQATPPACYHRTSIVAQILEMKAVLFLVGALAWDGQQASISAAQSRSRLVAAGTQIAIVVRKLVAALFFLCTSCCGDSHEAINIKVVGCYDITISLAAILSSVLLLLDPNDTTYAPEVALMLTGISSFLAVKRSIYTVASRYGGTRIDMSNADNRGVSIGTRVN